MSRSAIIGKGELGKTSSKAEQVGLKTRKHKIPNLMYLQPVPCCGVNIFW